MLFAVVPLQVLSPANHVITWDFIGTDKEWNWEGGMVEQIKYEAFLFKKNDRSLSIEI